jgi:hypothetical protein
MKRAITIYHECLGWRETDIRLLEILPQVDYEIAEYRDKLGVWLRQIKHHLEQNAVSALL